ncbi:MAG: hypothetical protein E6I75_23245 [Chloroflexi bacterium]|nr:MAG: hypothetical protein E6I75_23245 [Chloroflexota bacterium]
MIAERVGNPAQDAPDYVALGRLAFAEDDFVATRDHWQSAFRQQRSSGNARGAARIAADLAALYAGVFGNEALAAGWLARAHRLLAGTGRCVEQGYVALAFLSMHRFDLAAVENDAALALELALEFADSDLEVLASHMVTQLGSRQPWARATAVVSRYTAARLVGGRRRANPTIRC